jgi:hypothetical protein
MRRVTAAMIAVAIVGIGIVVRAQAPRPALNPQPARNWSLVNIVTLKPEMANEWVEFQKAQTIPAQKRGGVTMRSTWQDGAPFGEGFTYAIVTPVAKFADFDQPPLITRTLGADAARAYNEKLRRMIDHSRTIGIQDRAELSIQPAANAKIVGAILTTVVVVNGHAAEYEAYIKDDLLPVLKRGSVLGYQVARTVFGGDANEYTTVQFFDSFAEIDKGPLTTRVLGAGPAAALAAKAAPHVASSTRTLLRYAPDLSFQPKPAS